MDSSISSHENYHHHIDSDEYQYQNESWPGFSLFQPFPADPQSVMIGGEQDGESADLSLLTLGSPKLEDFLGGGGEDSGAQTVFSRSNKTRKTDNNSSNSPTFARPSSPEESRKQLVVAKKQDQPPAKKAIESFGQRTSIYRGVTRHRWTGRYEAHLWDNSCRREGQSRKGRQGGYDKEERAARAYDLAALKYWGPTTTTNFPASSYEKELEEMKNMTRQEFVASLRRKSSGFSRGASMYRGVTRHHQHGRWQARIGRVAGNKDLYLGTFSTQEEAAEAYDIAAIKFRGVNAVTNFDMSRYDVNSIATSNLPVGGTTTKSKTKASSSNPSGSLEGASRNQTNQLEHCDLSMSSSSITFGLQPVKQDSSDYWPMIAYNQQSYDSTVTEGLYQQSTTFSMEFSSTMMHENINTDVGYFNTGGGGSCINSLQQSNVDGGASSSISFATPMDLNMNNLQQQSSVDGGASSSISFATPVDLNSNINDNTAYYGGMSSGNLGNWNVSSQSARASNFSVYQSPIFGME
ncbi:AP2-like ethylene-responsive transcription factor AIL5 [Heracleum sosnowskyi]|uniref:AP2-like ethylene-responsive transcription factor AIL5 n=1 Tax=Heracleum sosnowskyi TaxID=360622 RepID=A0AAD8N2V4_9APIA|nr:AP2-like ethylene-responsive transcription factor AIL5 [Heracleum sosnowskyi]